MPFEFTVASPWLAVYFLMLLTILVKSIWSSDNLGDILFCAAFAAAVALVASIEATFPADASHVQACTGIAIGAAIGALYCLMVYKIRVRIINGEAVVQMPKRDKRRDR